MNILSGMCRHIVLHHRLLAVVLILYLLAGGYVSLGNFHPTRPTPPGQALVPPQPVPDLSKMTAVEQAQFLQGLTKEALNRAILYPTRENTATYQCWQKFWTDRATMFRQSFAVAQLRHPDPDCNLEYPDTCGEGGIRL